MKIYIGPYKNWVGPYQIADLLQYVGVSEDRCRLIGEWLDKKTPLTKVCKWFYNKRKRNVKIKIHNYDVWNMDNTLSYIILPLLKEMKEDKQGSPFVDNEDIPIELRSENQDEFGVNKLQHERWDWVFNEIMWTFEQIHPEHDWEDQYYTDKDPSEMKNKYDIFNIDSDGYKKHQERINNGLKLFGKYYQALWT